MQRITYIYQRPDWPAFRWDSEVIASQLAAVRHRQGRLLGRMEALGFASRVEATLQTLTQDALKTSEIEGDVSLVGCRGHPERNDTQKPLLGKPVRPAGQQPSAHDAKPSPGRIRGQVYHVKMGTDHQVLQDTALPDIADLIRHGILVQDAAGGRSTSYSLAE